MELSKNELYLQNGHKNLAYVFSMLLENEPDNTEEIRTRMELYGYNLLPDLYLMVVPVSGNPEKSLSFIATTLQSIFSNSIYFIRKEDILFLISRPQGRELSDFELDVWDSQLRRLNLHGGLSPVFPLTRHENATWIVT